MADDPHEKWKNILLNPHGKSKDQVQQEIRDMHKESQLIDDAIQREAILQVIKARKTYKNLTNPNNNADKSKLVPIDGDIKAGALVFMRACASCHSLEIFTGGPVKAGFSFQQSSGPSLAQIYNKPAASNRTFEDYSISILESKIYWNSYNLYMWPKNPQAMSKGTKCMKTGNYLENDEERYDLKEIFELICFTKATNDLYRRAFTKFHGYEWQNYREQGLAKAKEVALQRQGYEQEKK